MTGVSARTEKPSGGRPHAVDSGSGPGTPSAALVEELLEELLEQVLGQLVQDAGTDPGVLLDVRRGTLRCLVVREARAILSPRELEIAGMVAQGHPTKRIAHTLEISGFTVNSHLRRIFTKLGVTSRAAMVAQLTHHGLVDLAGTVGEQQNGHHDWHLDDA